MAYKGHTPNFQNAEQYNRWLAQQGGDQVAKQDITPVVQTPVVQTPAPVEEDDDDDKGSSSNNNNNNNNSNSNSNNNYYTPSNTNNSYTAPSTPLPTIKPILPSGTNIKGTPRVRSLEEQMAMQKMKEKNGDRYDEAAVLLSDPAEQAKFGIDPTWMTNMQYLSDDDIKNTFTYRDRKRYGLDKASTSVRALPDGSFEVVTNKGNKYQITGKELGKGLEFEKTHDWRDLNDNGVGVGEAIIAPFRNAFYYAPKEGIDTLKRLYNSGDATIDKWNKDLEERGNMAFAGVDKFGYTRKGMKGDKDDNGIISDKEAGLILLDNFFGADDNAQNATLNNVKDTLTMFGMDPKKAQKFIDENSAAILVFSSLGNLAGGAITGGIPGAIKGAVDMGRTMVDVAVDDKFAEQRAKNKDSTMKNLYNIEPETRKYSVSAKDDIFNDVDDVDTDLTVEERAAKKKRQLRNEGKIKVNTDDIDKKKATKDKESKVLTSAGAILPTGEAKDEEDKKASDALLKTYVVKGLNSIKPTDDAITTMVKYKIAQALI